MRGATREASSARERCRSCGTEKELQKDSYVDEKGLIAPWPHQSGGGMTSGAAARLAGTAKGPAQVLAQTRLQLTQAREQGHPEECIRILECKVLKEEPEMRQAEPMGERMNQARARFRRAVEAGEKAQRPRRTSSAAEVVQAQLDLHKLMQEAPLPVMPAPQVNVNQVKSLEALTGLIENVWNPEAGPPPDPLIHAIQESRAILQTSSAILSQEGGAAVEAETGAEQDPELWDQDEGEAEEMADFEEAHAPGGPPVEPRQTRKAAAERAPPTPPQQKKTTEPEALAKGSTFSGPAYHESHAESQRHGTRHAFATSMRANPSLGKFLNFCFLAICTVACCCSHARPGRRWPTCFDQTCGYPGEGPLTTLDSPEGPEPRLTPTQELRTCVMVRRKTKVVTHPKRTGTRARILPNVGVLGGV